MKSASSSQIKEKAQAQDMAMAVAPPVPAIRPEDGVMDTLQRPQNGGGETGSVKENGEEGAQYKPDLSKEVAMLSTKLINAINHQTNLDDSLQATRHELDWAKQEVKRLRAEKQSLDDAIAQGVLVRKAEVDKTIAELRAQLAIEKMNRERAETSKKATEGELENLTTSLFEEANKMVEAAKKETKDVEKRNSQLKNQLNDQEAMLKSQQDQLHDMRLTLDKTEASARESGSTPNTPITAPALPERLGLSPNKLPPSANIPPDHPLHFSQLITPVLRTDVASYTDFAELLAWARRGAPHSRSASGNMASASTTNLSSTNVAAMAATSSPNLPGAFSFGSQSANSSPNSSNFAGGAYAFTPPLKESKFYKRALIEDIEPTLRLDLAPGLSFLSRRTVNAALLNGTLSIEPFTPPTKFYSPIFACAMCGESRKTEPYTRRHRFRTSESEDASKYPLCEFCLSRVRSAADFVSFLRMVKDGHWRCDNEEEERKAWEEAVRMRERMFWARLGGGVVPASILDRMRDGKEGEGEVEWEADAGDRLNENRWSGLLKGAAMGKRDEIQELETDIQEGDEGDEKDDGEGGIGKVIVNMSSQAASSTMPELKPMDSSAFHTPEQEVPPPVTPENKDTAVSDSEADQAAASSQLRSEAESQRPSSPPSATEPTPSEPAASPQKSQSRPSSPQKETESRPSTAQSSSSHQRTMSRPGSGRSLSPPKGERSLSPAKGRPTSGSGGGSGVMARVRAMEGK